MLLFIDNFGSYLYKKDDLFLIKASEGKKSISPQRVSSIIISNAATISTDAIQLATENNIDIVFLNKFGEPYARVWAPTFGSTATIRRRQLCSLNSIDSLRFVQYWISRKIDNQIGFIRELAIKRPLAKDYSVRLNKMEDDKARVLALEKSLDEVSFTIMALEGNASKHYLSILSDIIPKKYRFKGRSSRPAKDYFNAFLNYGYGVLYSKVEIALIIAGLDPYTGFLHSDNYNKKSLVFDFIEPYRILIDKPTFYLFSRQRISSKHIKQVKDGYLLNKEGKELLLKAIFENFDRKIRYGRRNIKQINQIKWDAHSFANYLIGKKEDFIC